MLNVDLKYLNPNFVICFTGSGDSTFWFSKMFLGYLDAVETDCVQWIGDNRFCIRVYHARGRYFLVAKTCLDFFPHISSVVMNDKVIVSIIPMINGKERERVLCTMDYHNQKFADIEYTGKNPRDE